MNWWQRLTHPGTMEQHLDKELRFHLEQHTADLVAEGHSPDEARRLARLALGGPEQVKEYCRDARGTRWLDETWQDFRYAARTLRKQPGFAALAILTLALGIGAACAVFSVVNAVLLRALPYRDPDQLVYLWEPSPHFPTVPIEAFAPPNADFYEWRKQSHSFSNLALFTVDSMNLAVNGSAQSVSASRVTGDFFALLGVAPELGRAVGPDDDQPGKAQVAVISHALWQSRFGADPHALGRQILLNARPYRIIGVMPAGFAFPHEAECLETHGRTTDIWLPLALTPQDRASREDSPGNAIARLRPGVSPARAQAEMAALVARQDPLHLPMFRDCGAEVRTFAVEITGSSRRALLIFMGAVLLVLLIACSNVATLTLARAAGRSAELGVRTALGASRLRLVRQLFAEALCLAGAGGILGALAASLAIRLLTGSQLSIIPRLDETSMDARVLFFAIAASLATTLLFGLLPAWPASRSNLNEVLKSSRNRNVSGAGTRLQGALTVAEVAFTFVLLAGSGLLIRSFLKLESVDKGFAPEATVTASIELDARYNRPEQQNALVHRLLDRIGSLPGVTAAAAINYIPLGGGESLTQGLQVEGQAFDEKTLFEERAITPRYFTAMGIPVYSGRAFTDDDVAGRPLVAIVNRSFARRYFPGGNAVGKHFHRGGGSSPTTIVGVVRDVRYESLETAPPLQIYTPLWQGGARGPSLVARTSLPPDRLASDMRAALREIDPALALADIRSMDQLVSSAAALRRFETTLLVAFGGIALFLSLVGLYGLLSYSVERRTAEMGIRMALGAQPSHVLRLVLKQGSALAWTGIALGLVCAWAVTRAMASLLFEVTPTDALSFVSAAVLFIAVAMAACCAPALRATRVDPMTALRHE